MGSPTAVATKMVLSVGTLCLFRLKLSQYSSLAAVSGEDLRNVFTPDAGFKGY